MADNVVLQSVTPATPAAGTNVAADEAAYSGDTAKVQVMRLVHVDGAEGSKTVKELIRLEDAAHTTGDPGLPILAVRKDTAAALAGTDGDYIPLIVDANGQLHVVVGGTVAIGSIAAGTNAIGKLAANSGVDIGDVDVTSVIPGTGATNLGKAEDAAHSTGDVGVMALGVRKDSATALALSDGDYAPFEVDAAGRLHVKLTAVELTDDAAFTAGANNVMPVGFIADEASIDSVDEGDIGAPRMTLNRILRNVPSLHDGTTEGAQSARSIGGVSATAPNTGVQAVAGGSFTLQLTSGTPVPTGSDIVNLSNAAIVSADLAIRNTAVHYFIIPMSGWSRVYISISTTAHDQTMTCVLYTSPTVGAVSSELMNVTIPASAVSFAVGEGAVGTGGNTGAATVVSLDHYTIPGLNCGAPFLTLGFVAGVAPTAGAITLTITRSRF